MYLINDNINKLSEIKLDNRVDNYDITSITYNGSTINSVIYSSGNKVSYTYDGDNLIKAEYYNVDGITLELTLDITYDIYGNILSTTKTENMI